MIKRRRHTTNFTTIPNATLQDEGLSYEALGLLAHLLSRPHDWKVHIRQLCGRRKRGGRDRIYRIVRELIDAGYIMRSVTRASGRVVGIEYHVTDDPRPEKSDTAFQDHSQITERDKTPLLPPKAAECSDAKTALGEGAFVSVYAKWTRHREGFPARRPESQTRARNAWAALSDTDRGAVADFIDAYYSALLKTNGTWPWSFTTYIQSRCWRYPRLAA